MFGTRTRYDDLLPAGLRRTPTRRSACWLLLLVFFLFSYITAQSQGTQTLYGDFKVDETNAPRTSKSLSYDLILYFDTGVIAARQTITNGGRFRFVNMQNGVYFLAVELENTEITRVRVELLRSNYKADHKQDIELTYRANPAASTATKSTISVDDFYERSPQNQKRFEKGQAAADAKKYSDAVTTFTSLVADDPKDFQALTELGTVYLAQQNLTEAEGAYLKATTVKPGFFLALFNLGRLRLLKKDFEGAIAVMSDALKTKPESAAANFYLGEAYLQLKKGSKAVTYLNEALRLDPVGMAEAHLRLGTLYAAVGMNDKAVVEYEQFLTKVPNYPDKKRLQDFVTANKKP